MPCDQGQNKGRQSGKQCGPADIAQARFRLSVGDENKTCTNQRQQDETQEQMVHDCAPPNIYHVMTAARPISMAKA